MRTIKDFRDRVNGRRIKQFMFGWNLGDYNLSTSEFSEDWDYHQMKYKTYLIKWLERINGGDKEYIMVRKKYKQTWQYTIVELLKGES